VAASSCIRKQKIHSFLMHRQPKPPESPCSLSQSCFLFRSAAPDTHKRLISTFADGIDKSHLSCAHLEAGAAIKADSTIHAAALLVSRGGTLQSNSSPA